jgi:hypothetical protein
MKTKFILIGAVVAGLVLFVWGAIWNTSLDDLVLRQFNDDTLVATAICHAAPTNGMYYLSRGVFAAVKIQPDMRDVSNAPMGPLLLQEGITDLVLGALLAMLVLAFGPASVPRDGVLLAIAGLAAGVGIAFSNSIWFGFPWSFALLETGEQVLGWLFAGMALGLLRRRLLPVPVPAPS